MIALASSNLRIGGLASGLDTESIIKDLMKAQRARLAKASRIRLSSNGNERITARSTTH